MWLDFIVSTKVVNDPQPKREYGVRPREKKVQSS